ncbi:MAG: transglutaminase domain-containing protein [Clostridiales bacterium]|nr:transglutaminase domain-containing protein [Clostridiales bacterium]
MKKLIIIILLALMIVSGFLIWFFFFKSSSRTEQTYDLTVSESILAVNFTLRRDERYNGEGEFDLQENYSQQGIVDLFYNAGTNKKVKLVISMGRERYTYDIKDDTKYIYFPLQLGNGEYEIEIYENVKDEKYKKVYKKKADVVIADDRLVYLNTMQIVNWQGDQEAVLLAGELIRLEKIRRFEEKNDESFEESDLEAIKLTDLEKIETIYLYVVQNIRYDHSKPGRLTSDYIPDIDDVFNEKEGICYDYSAIMASMLRSLKIPTKLIKGYTTNTSVFHAWNEVYIEDENRWIIVDTTYDSYLYERNKVFELEKSEDDYTNVYEY